MLQQLLWVLRVWEMDRMTFARYHVQIGTCTSKFLPEKPSAALGVYDRDRDVEHEHTQSPSPSMYRLGDIRPPSVVPVYEDYRCNLL